MKYILALLSFILVGDAFSQDKLFRNTPKKIADFQQLASKASYKNDSIHARAYNDSIRNYIINSKIDTYTFKTIDGKFLTTENVSKPIFLVTSASWCGPCRILVKPLNKIAEEYSDKIQFVVLYWDTKEKIDGLAKKNSSKVTIVPSPNQSSSDGMMGLNIAGFTHSLGYPTHYLIKNKIIIDYFTGALEANVKTQNSKEGVESSILDIETKTFNLNYELLKTSVEKLLK